MGAMDGWMGIMAVNADGSFSPSRRPPHVPPLQTSGLGAVVWPQGFRVEGGHSSWNELVRLHFPQAYPSGVLFARVLRSHLLHRREKEQP